MKEDLIYYVDYVNISNTKYGMVLEFGVWPGKGVTQTVTRLGMSKEFLKELVNKLESKG